jgi:hypothetical protein
MSNNLQLYRMTLRVHTLFFAVVFFGSRPLSTSAITLTIVPPFSLPLTLYSLCVAAMQGWTQKSYIHSSKIGLFCSMGALYFQDTWKNPRKHFTSKNAAKIGFFCSMGAYFQDTGKKSAKTFIHVKMLQGCFYVLFNGRVDGCIVS